MRPVRLRRIAGAPWHHVAPREFKALFDATASSCWPGTIALAYCCGLWLSEILNLTWADVDFRARTVRVVAKRGRETEDWAPQDKDMRIVPLPGPASVALTKLRLAREAEHPYVFTIPVRPNAGKYIARRNTWRDFDVSRRWAGLPPCSMHDLRSSYCTNLARLMPMHRVQSA